MNTLTPPLLVGLFFQVWILALVMLRSENPILKLAFSLVAFAGTLINSATIASVEGLAGADWEFLLFSANVLLFASLAHFVLTFAYGWRLFRRGVIPLVVFAPALGMIALAYQHGWSVSSLYEPGVPSVLLMTWLGVAATESILVWVLSSATRIEAFLVLFGTLTLIIGGPVYSLESRYLTVLEGNGSNILAPVALVALGAAVLRMNPMKVPRDHKFTVLPLHENLGPGKVYLINERRPKYSYAFYERLKASGYCGISFSKAEWKRGQIPLRRIRATLLDLVGERKPLAVIVEDLSPQALEHGESGLKEFVRDAAEQLRSTPHVLIICTGRLTESERKALAVEHTVTISLTDFEERIASTLQSVMGGAGKKLLERYCEVSGRRAWQLDFRDVGPIAKFATGFIMELEIASDSMMSELALMQLQSRLEVELAAIGNSESSDRATIHMNSRAERERDDEGIVILPSEYWRDSEKSDASRACPAIPGDRLKTVFAEAFGSLGDRVLKDQLRKLNKGTGDLSPDDVAALVVAAEETLRDMESAIDLPSEKENFRRRARRLRSELLKLAGGTL